MKAKPTKRRGEVILQVRRRDEALVAAAERQSKTAPFRLKRVLVPIDFSECSRKALEYAVPLAEEYGAVITLLYVIQIPAYVGGEFGTFNYINTEGEMRESGQKELSAFIKAVIRDRVQADTMITAGAPAQEIVKTAKQIPADLIVISTHGRTGLKHVFMGSVAEHVVRYASCPVLVVHEHQHEMLAAA